MILNNRCWYCEYGETQRLGDLKSILMTRKTLPVGEKSVTVE